MKILIDTHAHLDFPQYRKDLEQVIYRAEEAGVVAVLNAGTDLNSSRRSVELSVRYAAISASVGVHPHGAAQVSGDWRAQLEKLAGQETVLAIVETGLDFYRNLSPRETQEQVFREQIRLAVQVNKPLIIHSREAKADTLRILKEENLPVPAGVMHCFSGDRDWLDACLDLDFYISIAGPVTYPRSHELRDLLRFIPEDRLLLETDAPYLSPQAFRSERNEPAYVKLTYDRVALALDSDPGQLATQVYLNAIRLFSDRLVD